MKRIVAYTDPVSAAPGESLRCHVSCENGADTVALELVRMHGGTPERRERVPCAAEGMHPARPQRTAPGSYGLIPEGVAPSEGGSRTFRVLVLPTDLDGRDQTLMSDLTPDGRGMELALDVLGRPVLLVGSGAGEPERLTLGAPAREGAWHVVCGGYDANAGEAFVAIAPAGAHHGEEPAPATAVRRPCPAPADGGPFALAARLRPRAESLGWEPTAPFTGRLERPLVAARVLGPAESPPAAELLGCWDFAQGISTYELVDVSGRGRHGTLHNLPMRGVCGTRWDGETLAWPDAPEQFAAIHFFAEGIEDAGWEEPITVALPDDLPSGFYALRLTAAGDEELVPVFVRPPRGQATARTLLLVPTATYMAYSNSRFWFEGAVQEMLNNRVVELGPEEQLLVGRPELGLSSYDQYRDGIDVCFVSRRRPNLNMRAGHVRNENYPSDLDIVAWLEHLDHPFDVATDEDLDREGAELLARYDTVLTGTHPEYVSDPMWDALDDYLRGGGRLLVLGGNALAFTVAFHPQRPWIMEVRKPDMSPTETSWHHAETHLAFTGVAGGERARIGRAAERLIGVGTASMGFDGSRPYERLAASHDPRVAFAFEGVEGDVIGAHGRLGGAVVFQEWDNADAERGTPPHALVLARSREHSEICRRFGAIKPCNHAEMVFFETEGGGAVFSAASMAWCAALADDGYNNDVARITRNVLTRFLDREPFGAPAVDSRSPCR